MEKKNWYWEKVPFIPDGVDGPNLLRFQGHIFVKSNVVRDLKAKGEFKKRERKRQKKRKK